jgi:hypothetical protein
MALDREKKKPVEFITVDETGKEKLNLHIFVESLVVLLMGASLDSARMAIQSDRAWQQFERSTKDLYYDKIEFAKKILEKYGHHDLTQK